MQMLPEEKIGEFTIRIGADGATYKGRLIRRGVAQPLREHADLVVLQHQLREEAGRLHPHYIGLDGALARFQRAFPDGIRDARFFEKERGYKLDAKQRLESILSLEAGLNATAAQAIEIRRAFGKTNVLHSTEFARVHQVLGDAAGAAFVRSAALFTAGDLEAGLAGMVAAVTPRGRASWPILTYLPSLWRPDEHMFLKPDVTRDYAERTGHPFQFAYSAEPNPDVYRSLLDLMAVTKRGLETFDPVDGIDVQSFIWVVGGYTDQEIAELEAKRTST